MMASKNLPRPITNSSEGPHWLRVLAAELALRLNELRATDTRKAPYDSHLDTLSFLTI